MAADPKMWEAFFDWCRNEIKERQKDLAAYESGSVTERRRSGGDWVDVTKERAEQVRREIASLENTLARFSDNA
jgi:hypothetical protein